MKKISILGIGKLTQEKSRILHTKEKFRKTYEGL